MTHLEAVEIVIRYPAEFKLVTQCDQKKIAKCL